MKRWWVAIVFSLAAGCAGTSPVQKRASFDFNCPEAELRVTEIDDRTQGVEGCGKRATYLLSCPGDCRHPSVCACNWVMNSAENKPQ